MLVHRCAYAYELRHFVRVRKQSNGRTQVSKTRDFFVLEMYELGNASAQVFVSPIVGWMAEYGCCDTWQCQSADGLLRDGA